MLHRYLWITSELQVDIPASWGCLTQDLSPSPKIASLLGPGKLSPKMCLGWWSLVSRLVLAGLLFDFQVHAQLKLVEMVFKSTMTYMFKFGVEFDKNMDKAEPKLCQFSVHIKVQIFLLWLPNLQARRSRECHKQLEPKLSLASLVDQGENLWTLTCAKNWWSFGLKVGPL